MVGTLLGTAEDVGGVPAFSVKIDAWWVPEEQTTLIAVSCGINKSEVVCKVSRNMRIPSTLVVLPSGDKRVLVFPISSWLLNPISGPLSNFLDCVIRKNVLL